LKKSRPPSAIAGISHRKVLRVMEGIIASEN
jgi:hypothetical protein